MTDSELEALRPKSLSPQKIPTHTHLPDMSADLIIHDVPVACLPDLLAGLPQFQNGASLTVNKYSKKEEFANVLRDLEWRHTFNGIKDKRSTILPPAHVGKESKGLIRNATAQVVYEELHGCIDQNQFNISVALGTPRQPPFKLFIQPSQLADVLDDAGVDNETINAIVMSEKARLEHRATAIASHMASSSPTTTPSSPAVNHLPPHLTEGTVSSVFPVQSPVPMPAIPALVTRDEHNSVVASLRALEGKMDTILTALTNVAPPAPHASSPATFVATPVAVPVAQGAGAAAPDEASESASKRSRRS